MHHRPIHKHSFLIFEVLLAFILVMVCVLPLVHSKLKIRKEESEQAQSIYLYLAAKQALINTLIDLDQHPHSRILEQLHGGISGKTPPYRITPYKQEVFYYKIKVKRYKYEENLPKGLLLKCSVYLNKKRWVRINKKKKLILEEYLLLNRETHEGIY